MAALPCSGRSPIRSRSPVAGVAEIIGRALGNAGPIGGFQRPAAARVRFSANSSDGPTPAGCHLMTGCYRMSVWYASRCLCPASAVKSMPLGPFTPFGPFTRFDPFTRSLLSCHLRLRHRPARLRRRQRTADAVFPPRDCVACVIIRKCAVSFGTSSCDLRN